ncbi:amidase [Curvibacter sp. PAE-UM]|uniref:amidase n=1 Tax=Curvibacter sp. PAE-UM TaxID=1714344 RepID=UPI00070FF25B|nr:amidase [Curvibacter sp. PAE-UM]KRI00136.1 branched-chain amino acid ABC transporter ATP-binding protein [Curvibacter sp. PAE-UM]
MRDITSLSVKELAAAVSRRELTAEAVTRAYTERIAALEPQVQAWQHVDAERALDQARALDRGGASGPLQGVPVGVKDLMDTADLPTTYGSPIYARHQPQLDAACVASCREAGAVILGKTVTTEFATFQPGPTRNPRAPLDAPHTPGGSSSGSAAAVAAGMVPLAFGTQTAGSIVRPASYCGVVGYKPTHGTLPLAGVKPLSPSLDTIGVLARSVEDAAFFIGVLARTEFSLVRPAALRVGLCQTPHWDRASGDARQALADAARRLEQGGARVTDLTWPAAWDGLTQAQIDIMGHEALAAFAPERRQHATLFSAAFTDFLAAARRLEGARVAAAYALADQARCALASVFADVDVLLAPSAEGEAPAGLGATGNPLFNRLWTLLGVPCVHVPTGVGARGLPVGVTVIGPRWGDAQTLAAAQLLQHSLQTRS